MNAQLLKSKMVLHGDEDFSTCLADVIGTSRQTASAKLDGRSKFTQPEISLIVKRYNLTGEEIREIFVEGDNEDESKGSS